MTTTPTVMTRRLGRSELQFGNTIDEDLEELVSDGLIRWYGSTDDPTLRWFTDGRPDPGSLDRVDAVRGILTCDGRTLAQGALAWIWARHPRTIPLPGFRNPAQVKQNAAALRSGPLRDKAFRQVEAALGR